MAFVDPGLLTQRHCLEDSDDEEDGFELDDTTFKISNPWLAGKKSCLIMAVGQPASIFARSYLPALPSLCTIVTDSSTIFKDRYFTSGSAQHSDCVVSEMFDIESGEDKEQNFSLCVLEKQLGSQYCSQWCNKVN